MSKHTPGPWSVGGPTEYAFQLSIEPSIGVVFGGGEEVQANARLIAAAPEMLEALDNAADALDSDNPDIQLRAAIVARAAITKVKGEA